MITPDEARQCYETLLDPVTVAMIDEKLKTNLRCRLRFTDLVGATAEIYAREYKRYGWTTMVDYLNKQLDIYI